MYILEICHNLKCFIANNQGSYGTWVHGSTNYDVTWFPSVINCWNDEEEYKKTMIHGGDTMMLGIFSNKPDTRSGAWCDWESSVSQRFICKAQL